MGIATARCVLHAIDLPGWWCIFQSVFLLNLDGRFLQLLEQQWLCLPKHLLSNVPTLHECNVARSVFRNIVRASRMFSFAFGDGDGVIAQRFRFPFECEVTLVSKFTAFALSLELANAFLRNVVVYNSLVVFGSIIAKLALDSCSPAPTVVATRYLDERRCKVNLVALVVNGLSTACSCVEFVPSVSVDVFSLLTGVSMS